MTLNGQHNPFEKKIKFALYGIGIDISNEIEKQYSRTLESDNSTVENLLNYEPQDAFNKFQKEYIIGQLRKHKFNIKDAAKGTQTTYNTFRVLMHSAGVKVNEEKNKKKEKIESPRKQTFDALSIITNTMDSYQGMFNWQINKLFKDNQNRIANYINNITQEYLAENKTTLDSINKYLGFSLKEAKEQFRKDYFMQKLAENNYNSDKTAKACNISNTNLRQYLAKSKISLRQLRQEYQKTN